MRALAISFSLLCLATFASGGRFVAVPDLIEPATLSAPTAQCRIQNDHNACGTIYWTVGGFCQDDEVTAYLDLPNDPCLAGCPPSGGTVNVESAEVGLRLVGAVCSGGYPVTSYSFDAQASIHLLDPGMSTPDCPYPRITPQLQSDIVTVPAWTATASTDPARTRYQLLRFPCSPPPWSWPCCFPIQPVFLGFRYISFSVPDSVYGGCAEGGYPPPGAASACRWWYPGQKGQNGYADQSPCSIPCTMYYTNWTVYGGYWFESQDAGFGELCDWDMFLNVNCYGCGVPIGETTWGKLKSMTR
jgi:hypothetical protein